MDKELYRKKHTIQKRRKLFDSSSKYTFNKILTIETIT